MADPKTQRKHLIDYTQAQHNMEVAECAITILGSMNTAEATRAIKALKAGQQRLLNKLDTAAAKLGAPYPTKD